MQASSGYSARVIGGLTEVGLFLSKGMVPRVVMETPIKLHSNATGRMLFAKKMQEVDKASRPFTGTARFVAADGRRS